MTAERGFSAGTILKYGWRAAKANFAGFAPMVLLIGVLAAAGEAADSAASERFPLNVLVSAITMAVSLAFSLGVVRVSLVFLDEGRASLRDLLPPMHLVPAYFMATILYLGMVVGGLLLLVVPGVLWGVRFSYYPFLIIDQGQGAVESLRTSARLTKGARWDVFALSILEAIANLLGLLCLGVGLLWTAPTGWLAKARGYRTLLAQSETPADAAQPAAGPAAADEDPPTAS